MDLPGGLLLRAARPADLDQIGALLADRGEDADPEDHRLVVEDADGGFDACAVVVDGDRVVSTATLLDETVVLAGLPIPAGQVELVATDRAYEGRGLVRALMGWAHERSAGRGHLMQVMIGIPYFYRQFGYQYAIPIPQSRAVHGVPAMPEGCTVRAAGPDDIAAMAELQDAVQRRFDVSMPHSPMCWRALVARSGSTQVVVSRDGRVIGAGRITPPDEGVVLGEVAGRTGRRRGAARPRVGTGRRRAVRGEGPRRAAHRPPRGARTRRPQLLRAGPGRGGAAGAPATRVVGPAGAARRCR